MPKIQKSLNREIQRNKDIRFRTHKNFSDIENAMVKREQERRKREAAKFKGE